jgi:hypothetical protein
MNVRSDATRKGRTREKREPDYVVRARNGRGWMQVGVAWERERGEDGLSIKINSVPVGFDGVLKVLRPLEPLEDEAPRE